jgi:hypothetical protein
VSSLETLWLGPEIGLGPIRQEPCMESANIPLKQVHTE